MKELQKLIKKRTVVNILDEDVDLSEARLCDWKRHLIVFSEPKVKELEPEAFESEDPVFKLYVVGRYPWSTRHVDEEVWKAASWSEFVENRDGGPDVTPDDVGLECLEMSYEDVLQRIRPTQGYWWFDCRYLGCCALCDCQPKFEYRKLEGERTSR
eukprot:SRR837773.11037.p1 GENE.SRR837773.11037~~SRR837773.11037.p1  ORF type:complete len:165 (+),score=56.88 SRR837773.11037:30-497(+)